jgi:hypothetical protein
LVQAVGQICYVLLRCFAEFYFQCLGVRFIIGLFSDTFQAANIMIESNGMAVCEEKLETLLKE